MKENVLIPDSKYAKLACKRLNKASDLHMDACDITFDNIETDEDSGEQQRVDDGTVKVPIERRTVLDGISKKETTHISETNWKTWIAVTGENGSFQTENVEYTNRIARVQIIVYRAESCKNAIRNVASVCQMLSS